MQDLLEAESNLENTINQTTEQVEVENTIPEKFQGKELTDVISMYENLQKEHSRQANELGQNRQTIDKFLELQLSQAQPQQTVEQLEEELEFTDFIDQPQEAIERIVQKRLDTRLGKTNEEVAALTRQLEQAKFEKKHPDWSDTVNSTDFTDWVQAQEYRLAKLKAADNYDFNSFDELLSNYREVATLKSPKTEQTGDNKLSPEQEALRQKQLANASLETGNNTANFSKHFIRAEVMKLKTENPTAYYAPEYQAELKKAYSEGRVK